MKKLLAVLVMFGLLGLGVGCGPSSTGGGKPKETPKTEPKKETPKPEEPKKEEPKKDGK